MMRKNLAVFVILAFALVLFLGSRQNAFADYPEKPITVYISFPAGGSTDLAARSLGPGLEKALGQQVVFVNKPGGTGTVAFGILAGEKPDGYTLTVGVNSAIIWNPIVRKLPYKPLADFTPVICFGTAPTGVSVRSDAPYQTWQEFVDYARKNPGKIKYGTTGAVSIFTAGMKLASKELGLKMVHIPYKGSMPAYTALLGGHVEAAVSDSVFDEFVKAGKLTLIAAFTKERIPEYPNTPTLIELGVNLYNNVGEYSLFGPAGMDPAIVKKLEDAVISCYETEPFKMMAKSFMFETYEIRNKELVSKFEQEWKQNEKLMIDLGMVEKTATPPK
ncbi:MAG: tripartite tricarboxylate transporter substrate binding protein [Acidobacteriota bacterium]